MVNSTLNLSQYFSQALSRTLTVDELFYLKEQFALLEPNKHGAITLDNVKTVGLSLSLTHTHTPACPHIDIILPDIGNSKCCHVVLNRP